MASRNTITMATATSRNQEESGQCPKHNKQAIWQRMDEILQGVVGVHVQQHYHYRRTTEEHLTILDSVLQRLQEYGLKVNQDKRRFLQNSVEYCGHIISAWGLYQSP